MLMECSERPEKVVEPPETEVIRGCQPPYGFQNMNLCPLQKQQMLLFTEPSLSLIPFIILFSTTLFSSFMFIFCHHLQFLGFNSL